MLWISFFLVFYFCCFAVFVLLVHRKTEVCEKKQADPVHRLVTRWGFDESFNSSGLLQICASLNQVTSKGIASKLELSYASTFYTRNYPKHVPWRSKYLWFSCHSYGVKKSIYINCKTKQIYTIRINSTSFSFIQKKETKIWFLFVKEMLRTNNFTWFHFLLLNSTHK